ncbi:MAG: copper chaperone PCu(A)C [Alphaproteobacteria bacterium]
MTTALLRLATAILIFFPFSLPAAEASGAIQVEQPWARATVGSARASAAYMTLRNDGAADRLLSASSPLAETVEIHTVIKEGTVMRMRPVPAIDLPAGGTARLAPGGFHIMLLGLRRPLKDGDRVPLTLTFEKAGAIAVEASVRPARHGGHQH